MKKIYFFLAFALMLSISGKSQCAANFSATIGSNGSVSFTNLSSGVSSQGYYYWDFGDNQYNYNVQNPVHVYGANGIYTVTIFINDSTMNCSSSLSQTLAISNVSCSLNAGLSANVNGAYVSYMNSTAGSYPGTTYTLNFGDGNSTTFTNNNFISWGHSYATSGSYTVTLTAYNSSTCTSTYTTVINVTVAPCNLNAGFTYTINNNGYVNFANTTTGANMWSGYYWSFGNGGSAYTANPGPQFYAPGTYTVSLNVTDSISGPCSDSYSTVITVTTCVASGNFVMVKDSSITSSIVWNAYPTYPSNVSGVTWSWGDGSTSNSYYPVHTYSSTGVYNICLTVSVSCGADTTICMNSSINRSNNENSQMATVNVVNTSLVTGIAKTSRNIDLTVYPNPAKNELTIEGAGAGTSIMITDLLGKTVMSQVQKDSKATFDISNLNPGIYIVRAVDESRTATTKIIKE